MQELQLASELDFTKLPDVLEQNKNLTERAKQAIEAKLKMLPADFKNLDIQRGDAIEIEVNDLRNRGAESEKLNKDRRMVFTKRMDEVKSLFTAQEKELHTLVELLKEWADYWNGEKRRRTLEAQKQQELKIAHDNAKSDYVRHVMEQMNIAYNQGIETQLNRMVSAFNNLQESQIDSYIEELKKWHQTPLNNLNYNLANHPLLTEEERQELRADTEKQHLKVLSGLFIENCTAEKNRQIEIAPSRKAELQRAATNAEEARKAQERLAKEEAERKAQLAKEEAERRAQVEAKADEDKLNNMFENAAAQPSIELSKGTHVKLKYDVQNHQQMIKVIQWWVVNVLPLMTVSDMNAKLSFMRTAASKALNKGEEIEGVPIKEDISTRTK